MSADVASQLVTVQAGITIRRLNATLDSRRARARNLGDITRRRSPARSRQARTVPVGGSAPCRRSSRRCEIVTGDGSVISCSPADEPELFAAARVGLGRARRDLHGHAAMCPRLHAPRGERAQATRRRARRPRSPRRGQRPLRVQLVPVHRTGAGEAEQPRGRPARTPSSGRSGTTRSCSRTPVERCVAGAAAGSPPDPWRSRARSLGSSGEWTRPSGDRVVDNAPRRALLRDRVRNPTAEVVECLRALRSFITQAVSTSKSRSRCGSSRATTSHCRWLSDATAHSSPCHVFEGRRRAVLPGGVERIMSAAGGRRTGASCTSRPRRHSRRRYPEWDRFQASRARVDPNRTFANPYLERRPRLSPRAKSYAWSVAATAHAMPASGSSTARRTTQPVSGS